MALWCLPERMRMLGGGGSSLIIQHPLPAWQRDVAREIGTRQSPWLMFPEAILISAAASPCRELPGQEFPARGCAMVMEVSGSVKANGPILPLHASRQQGPLQLEGQFRSCSEA